MPLTVPEVYVYILFFLWLFTARDWRTFRLSGPFLFYYGAAALIFIGVSLGVLLAPPFLSLPDGSVFAAGRAALGVWKGWVVAPLLYFFVLTQALRGGTDALKLLRAFVYSAVAVSLVSYGFALFGDGVTYDFRFNGFYESANHLALYIAPAVALNLVWVFQRRQWPVFQRMTDTATLTVLLHALLFTQSYAAILALFGSFFLFGIVFAARHRHHFKKVFVGLLLLCAALTLMMVSQLGSPKFRQFLDTENRSSTTVRFEIYRVSARLIRDHWFFGAGPGLFQARYQLAAPDVLGRAPMEMNIPHPHNIFFAFWLNAGLLGLVALLLIHLFVHRRFTFVLPAFWVIILHGFFDTPFWKNDLAMVFWLIIAAILLLQLHGTDSAKKSAAGTRA